MDLVQALMLIFFLWLFVVVVNSGVTVHHKYKIKQIENQIRYIKGELEESCQKYQQQKIINILYQAVLDDGIKELMQERKAHMEDIEKLDGVLSDFLKERGK